MLECLTEVVYRDTGTTADPGGRLLAGIAGSNPAGV
jgi:hypothetical protein